MNLMDAIFRRRATRAYRHFPVGDEVIHALLRAAVMAPSAMNLQPWSFVLVKGTERLRHVSGQARAYMLTNRDAALPASLKATLEDPAFDLFYGAPALLVVCATSPAQQAAEDCAMAAQNLMLAACEHQLASCCIGLARGWLDSAAGRSALGLPAEWIPIVPIALGYAAEEPPAPARREPLLHVAGDD
ncbi:MAG TPA: nitroreductase [Nevskiaceae bacterium]|nr:nitroreductase [Nevskiaceae bacterium]